MNRKITAAFFSPTGGTKRAVETLCACWGGEVNWVQLGTKEPVQINLGADELLVLGLPVYAGVIPQVPGLLAGDGVFLCSGIIDTRAHEVEAALQKAGLTLTGRREKNGWVALEAKL